MKHAAKYGPYSRRLVARIVILGVTVLLLRFAYVVAVRSRSWFGGGGGGVCFFSPGCDAVKIFSGGSATLGRVADDDPGSTTAQRDLWTSKEWRRAVDFYSSAFQALIGDGFLSSFSKSLCVGSAVGYEVLALKEIGVAAAIGLAKIQSPPLVVSGNILRLPFKNDTFDFIFSGGGAMENSPLPLVLAAELTRTLKPEGFLAIHTSSAGDEYSLHSLLDLFPSCRLIRSQEIHSLNFSPSSKMNRDIILQKRKDGNSVNKCNVPDRNIPILRSAEPLIMEEPLKPWIAFKKNIQNVKYLPLMADIRFKRKYIYIDVGARSYGSSIGSWFKKQYPKQGKTFEIYAIEADKAFHGDYASRKGVTLLPFAAWVRNETLTFEVSHDPEDMGQGMGRIRPTGPSSPAAAHAVQGLDFAEWLRTMVSETDFVVVKMDVEGTEFDLIPRLYETGAVCLIDELFLECHYNRWQKCCSGKRSPKFNSTYLQCLDLLSSLRKTGVLVHQWW